MYTLSLKKPKKLEQYFTLNFIPAQYDAIAKQKDDIEKLEQHLFNEFFSNR